MTDEKPDSSNSQTSRQALLKENRLLRQKLAETEKASQSRNERESILSKAIKLGYWEWDNLTDKPIYFSEQFAHIHGFSQSELYEIYRCEEDLFSFIHPEDLEHYKRQIAHEARNENLRGQAHVFDYRIVRPNGEIRHVREMEYGFKEEDSKPTRLYGAVQDITDHKEALEARIQSEERYRSLFSQLPLGFDEQDYTSVKKGVDEVLSQGVENLKEYFINNPDLLRDMVAGTRITNVNEALVKIHGAESVEEFCAFDDDIDDWWSDDWVNHYASEIEALMGPDKIYMAEVTESQADDSCFETRIITKVVRGYEDTWERVVTLHEDISERKQIEIALLDAKNEAEESSQAKSQFLSRMSHELRTPLNAIMGFSQLFEYDKDLRQKQRSNAQKIYQAGSHLLSLVDEILDLTRIESGEIELSMEPVSLSEILADSVTWVDKMAASQHVSVQFDRDQFDGLFVQADALRLKQVFLNLLSNAVKYNNANGSVRIHSTKQADDRIRIGVSDTGPGISNDQMDHLFEPFNRLGAESSVIEGTGIGLVITRQLIHAMQGRIEVESVPGEGSTFWVELPLARLEDVEHMMKPVRPVGRGDQARHSQTPAEARILVAEDIPANRELIAAQLNLLGYTADYVENGVEALKLWQQGKYQLLMTDIRMPEMDGYELIRQIRQLDANSDWFTPVIAVTANAMAGDRKRCLAVGASDVMTKPFKLDELRLKLEKWMRRGSIVNRPINQY